jgi:PhnB protein
MTSKAKPVPEGYHTATPYLILKDAAAAIDFYKKAFGAVELERIPTPGGRIAHAEIKIGDSPFMMTDENPDFPDYKSPVSRGGSTTHIYLYVEDADKVFSQAIAAGATQISPLEDQFYGDRVGGLRDPFGHVWYVATRFENLSEAELLERAKAHSPHQSQS